MNVNNQGFTVEGGNLGSRLACKAIVHSTLIANNEKGERTVLIGFANPSVGIPLMYSIDENDARLLRDMLNFICERLEKERTQGQTELN